MSALQEGDLPLPGSKNEFALRDGQCNAVANDRALEMRHRVTSSQ